MANFATIGVGSFLTNKKSKLWQLGHIYPSPVATQAKLCERINAQKLLKNLRNANLQSD